MLYWSDSPYINHFLQPDSIIPDLSNPQSWNRYSYVQNRPVNFNDPTGHAADQGGGGGYCDTKCKEYKEQLSSKLKNKDKRGGRGDDWWNDVPFYSFDGGWNDPEYSSWNFLRSGAACTACHVTHWTGTIPTNDQISLTQVQGWRSLDRYALAVHAGGFSAISFYALEAIAAEESNGIQLYRGLKSDHPQLQTYNETGNVIPRDGSASVRDHVMGNTKSNYTSWTTNIDVAKDFAGSNGTILQINTGNIPNATIPTYQWSPFDEFEILIEGVVKGAKVFIP